MSSIIQWAAVVAAPFLSVVRSAVPPSSLHRHTRSTPFLSASFFSSNGFLCSACLVVWAVHWEHCSLLQECPDQVTVPHSHLAPANTLWSADLNGTSNPPVLPAEQIYPNVIISTPSPVQLTSLQGWKWKFLHQSLIFSFSHRRVKMFWSSNFGILADLMKVGWLKREIY